MIRTIREQDTLLEGLWQDLGDIPLCEKTETIEIPFLHFPVGTDKEEIWHWFDERHSKGVAYLLGFSYPPVDELIRISTEYLPKCPIGNSSVKHSYWTDGEDILCASKDACNRLSEFLQAVFSGADSDITISSGQYDSTFDKANGTQDIRTGYYYIHFN